MSRFGQLHDAYAEKPDWRDATDDPRWIAHIEEGVSSWTAEQDADVASIDTDDLTKKTSATHGRRYSTTIKNRARGIP